MATLAPAPSPWLLLRRRLESLMVYAPMVLMALLALASYWLLRATPEAAAPAPARVVRHDPTDVMRQFAVRTFDEGGGLRTEVFGEEARHYPDDGSMEIDSPRIRHTDERGVLVTATARRAWANGAQTEFTLRGNAIVVRDAATLTSGERLDRLEFRGESLHVWSDQHRVTSDQPVELWRGSSRVTANQLDYRETERLAVLTGRVRATLMPRSKP
jgi:lipopolysaccharide export system protein LptC